MVLKISEILFGKLREGDQSAMKEIFTVYYTSVYHTIHRMINNHTTAEDIAQEVFIDLWTKREQLQINSNIEAYLRKMAVNKTLNHLRSIKNSIFHDDADDVHSTESFDPFVDESFHDLEETIHKCIDSMPTQRKLIFVLSRFEDYTNKMIADHLGLSIKTVENQMTKALKTLRHTIEYYKR